MKSGSCFRNNATPGVGVELERRKTSGREGNEKVSLEGGFADQFTFQFAWLGLVQQM